jgi:ribosomal protein S17E
MDTAEIKKRKAELEKYYKELYDKDAEAIKEEAMQYAENDVQRAKDYIAGYLSSIKQPHTRTIRLVTMYVMDFVPYFRKHPDSKNMVTRIREIFRDKRYPDGLFDPKDPSKRVDDEVRKSKCSETSGTTEE